MTSPPMADEPVEWLLPIKPERLVPFVRVLATRAAVAAATLLLAISSVLRDARFSGVKGVKVV